MRLRLDFKRIRDRRRWLRIESAGRSRSAAFALNLRASGGDGPHVTSSPPALSVEQRLDPETNFVADLAYPVDGFPRRVFEVPAGLRSSPFTVTDSRTPHPRRERHSVGSEGPREHEGRDSVDDNRGNERQRLSREAIEVAGAPASKHEAPPHALA